MLLIVFARPASLLSSSLSWPPPARDDSHASCELSFSSDDSGVGSEGGSSEGAISLGRELRVADGGAMRRR